MSENNDLSALSNKDLCIAVLREVAADRYAPAQSRQAAARSLGECAGLLGKNSEAISDTSAKDLSSMTAQELDAEIRRIGKKYG